MTCPLCATQHHTSTQPCACSTAHAVVTHPAQFASQLALRESAWQTLVEARGGTVAAHNLPIVTHAQPGRPARGVAAHLADRLTHNAKPRQLTLADCVARARPATLAAIASREARARRTHPIGGPAA